MGSSFRARLGPEELFVVCHAFPLRVCRYTSPSSIHVSPKQSLVSRLPSGGIGTFGPLIIKGFGFNQVSIHTFYFSHVTYTDSFITLFYLVPNATIQHSIFRSPSYRDHSFCSLVYETQAQMAYITWTLATCYCRFFCSVCSWTWP